ncbi:MAG: hypothetical protein GX136_03795 [Clostridiales bacterium]|jgi:hypothetical protein|nr:hypothetical protein [Clostridiales bacterium]
MINFKFNLTTRYKEWHNYKSYDYLEYEGEFTVTINSKTFFQEPYFTVLEFLRDALDWVGCENKTKPMLYNSIETEENPLISFIERSGKWYVQSPWQKYECDITFTRGELEKAVLDLKHTIIKEHPEFQTSSTLKEE